MAPCSLVHRVPARFTAAATRRLLPFAISGNRSLSSVAGYGRFKTLAVTEPANAVMQVEISRPDKANAMSSTFFAELRDCFQKIAIEPACRAVILCGSGKVFSSGLDLEENASTFREMTSSGAEHGGGSGGGQAKDPARKAFEIARFVTGMQESLASVDRCPKPVISAIHSACVGGGVDLVCATDIRLASADAWFSIKEVDIGLCADLGTLQRLPKLIGSDSLARELVFTARRFPAAEALHAGFVSKILEDKQELLDHAVKLGSDIAARSPVAMQGSKINLNYGRDHTLAQALQYQALWSAAMLQTRDIPTAMVSAAKGNPPPLFPPV